MKQTILLMREVICEKTMSSILMECRWKFVGEKCEISSAECLHRILCLFHVWTIEGACRHTETMGGLSVS